MRSIIDDSCSLFQLVWADGMVGTAGGVSEP